MPCSGGIFDIERKQSFVDSIDHDASQPDFWDNPAKAQAKLKDKAQHEQVIADFKKAETGLDDAVMYLEMAATENDESVRAEAEQALRTVEAKVLRLEFQRMLSGPNDRAACFVEINAGAGGVEAMDWAQMLFRMYARYADRKGWKMELNDETPGEEAGLKSVSFAVKGGALPHKATFSYAKSNAATVKLSCP